MLTDAKTASLYANTIGKAKDLNISIDKFKEFLETLKKSPYRGNFTFDGVQNTYLISFFLGSYMLKIEFSGIWDPSITPLTFQEW
jgi:hypothetical protein